VLKADGITLWTNYLDKWPGDPAFAPVFDELNRRKAAIFFHPSAANCCRQLIPGVYQGWVEYDFDTTRTVMSFLVNGTLVRCPDIRYIFSHSGGTLPVLSGRIKDMFERRYADRAPRGVLYELKKLYYEVAHATYPSALAALMKLAPSSQILFGSDYGMPYSITVDELNEAGLSARDLQAINRGNAERLFPRFKS
jgi:predicted TIM-barrel fold metal-dependent hydrolase